MKNILALCVVATAIGGCATKQYGRVQNLSSAEKELYSCREIQIEYQKLEQFEHQIDDTGSFDGKTVLGFLGDLGIGNGMAKSDAKKSLKARRVDLDNLSALKKCSFGHVPSETSTPETETKPEEKTES